MYPLEPQSVDALQALVMFVQLPEEHVWFPEQVLTNWGAVDWLQLEEAVPGLEHVYVL